VTDGTYRVSWKLVRGDWPVFAALLLDLGFHLWALPRLPERVPIHWNAAGQPDNWGSPLFHTFGLPAVALGVYLLVLLLPLLDPRRQNYALFGGALRLIRWLPPIFMLAIHVVTTLAALGQVTDVTVWIWPMAGALFAVLGGVMGQLRHNYFVGIRTPWTLADEEVWRRTHRMAGPLWVIGGLLVMGTPILPATWRVVVTLVVLGAAALVPVVYSYLLYARKQ
jgi:uncharacterized membrane protein